MTGAAKAPVFKRVLLKLSGEVLMGEGGYGISPEVFIRVAMALKEVVATGIQLAIVVGGGNIFRGVTSTCKALSYDRVRKQKLAVMDATAIALCREQSLPVRVFNINKPGNVLRIVLGEGEGTLMQAGD